MADTTITSANSIFVITVPGLYPSGALIQGYSSDRAFTTDNVVLAETQMGVDGRMTAGHTPNKVKQTVTLQADSPSKDIFNTLIQTTKTTKDIYYLSAIITLPSTGEVFTLTRGVLVEAKQIPDAQKVLQPVDYSIEWESINRAVL